jgi:hypothetical protein
LQAENSQHTYSYNSFHVHPVFYFECKVTAQKKSDQKNPRKNEILALLQTLSPNLALFQRLQLVYGQHSLASVKGSHRKQIFTDFLDIIRSIRFNHRGAVCYIKTSSCGTIERIILQKVKKIGRMFGSL